MAQLSASGIGSGLDVNGLLQQIVDAERAPKENRLNLQEARTQAEISAFGSLKSAITSFKSSISSLKTASGFSVNSVSIGNPDLLSASASSIATEGSYSVEVQSLAQQHSLASIAFNELDTIIGTGTLTFKFGTTDYDSGTDTYTSFTENPDTTSKSVAITNENNTVEGVRDAINAAGIGVRATIVDDGTGYKLLITSENGGVDNSLEITVDEGGAAADNIDTTGLSQLAFNINATNSEQTQAAADAIVKVNGLTIHRDSNTITGAIHGVTLNLKSADIGVPTQVTINRDDSKAETNITEFVNRYNELVSSINQLTEYGGEDGQSGLLIGDSTTRTILAQIREELVMVIPNDSVYSTLSSIGITTQRDGTLELDSSKLNAALADDFDTVSKMFFSNATPSDEGVSFISSNSATEEGTYSVRITQLATQGSLVGDAVAGPVLIDNSNDTIYFTVDGVSTGAVTLTQSNYTDMDALAAEIESRLNANSNLQDGGVSVSVSYNGSAFEVSSSKYGSESTIAIGSNNDSLGFNGNAVITDGVDVEGLINGVLASGEGQRLTGAGAASGLVLDITGGTTGNRGTISFSKGYAGRLDALLSNFLSADGLLTSKTDSLDAKIEDIAAERENLYERVAAIEARYRSQFVALDVLIGQLNVTSDYLQRQIDSIPKVGASKN